MYHLSNQQGSKMKRLKRSIKIFWDTKIHFLELHYLYILFLILIFSGLYYCESDTDWNYIDALFMATTGSTNTGLNTIPVSDMSTYQMVLLYLSAFIGSHVTISFVVVMVRRYYFQKRFEEVLEFNQKRKEEYKRLKVLREQQEQQRKREQQLLEEQQRRLSDKNSCASQLSGDEVSTTRAGSKKSSLNSKGALGRRLSLLSVRSTPVQRSTPRHSLFSRSLFRRGSFDTDNSDNCNNRRDSSDNNGIELQPNYKFDGKNSHSVIDMERNNATNDNDYDEKHHRYANEAVDYNNLYTTSTHPYDTSNPSPTSSSFSSVFHSSNANKNQNSNDNANGSHDTCTNGSFIVSSPSSLGSESQEAKEEHGETGMRSLIVNNSVNNNNRNASPLTYSTTNDDTATSSASNQSSGKNTAANNTNNQQITFREDTNILRERERRKLMQHRLEEEGMITTQPQHIQIEEPTIYRTNSENEIMRQPSAKSQLTKNERYRMGGTEYRALDMLARLVPIYYLGFIIGFGFLFRIYVAASSYAREVLATTNGPEKGPVDPWFFSFFQSLSAFNNLGLNHLDASMAPFQNAPAPLILSIILILVGNTAFAILMRFMIWVCYCLTPKYKVMRRETFRYLLDHPRRCYTTLFPSTQTWWLLIVLVAITLVELVCFLALNYWLPVLANISWGSRFLDGLFQSVATRNAGFSVIALADLNPGTQLVYIVAMYISVYPVAISMRNSNIYQERALGIFRGENEEPVSFSENELANAPFIKLKRHSTMTSIKQNTRKFLKGGPDFFVITQIQRQLTSDICWVITGIFCICIIESQAIMSPSPVTMATVIYECVSAFGNVGASQGFPNTATSQAAQYRTLSKLVLIILMYRGRHRGLPAAIDRSILLPSEQLVEKEKEDEERRRNTSASIQLLSDSGTSSGIQTLPHHDHLIYTRSCTL